MPHTDDTGVRVLDKDDARGVKRGHLWPYVGQEKCDARSEVHLGAFLWWGF